MGLLTSASAAAILSSMVWLLSFIFCDLVIFFFEKICARESLRATGVRTVAINIVTEDYLEKKLYIPPKDFTKNLLDPFRDISNSLTTLGCWLLCL
jgi:hypothetical protein